MFIVFLLGIVKCFLFYSIDYYLEYFNNVCFILVIKLNEFEFVFELLLVFNIEM